MKKSLVLAMAMAMGISATAFAANPFSDVPAGHWAYGSISKLAAAGVVDGYPDGTFKGDNLMTRYEMAQIVAKAYAKGAIGADDKLMAEFADELDNLGVRVAKLEKKSDNVKITGAVRALYKDVDKSDKGHDATLRTRLWVNGAINDDWTYTAMLENTQDLSSNKEESDTEFRRAYVNGKIGGLDLTAGRFNYVVGEGNVWDDHMDAVKLDFGNALKVSLAYGRANDDGTGLVDGTDAYIATLGYDFGKVGFDAAYYNFEDAAPSGDDAKIWTAGLKFGLGKDVTLGGEYLKADEKTSFGDDDGYVISLGYKGANAAEKGSFGLWAKYYDQAATTYFGGAHTTDAVHESLDADGGFKGYSVGLDYALAKNIVATVQYFDLDSKGSADLTTKTLWSDVTFTF